MRYPNLLQTGDTIGVCAPSSGVRESAMPQLINAARNVGALGYAVIETPSVRHNAKTVSADAKTRAAKFMALYEDPSVAAILPPWGGEFLMDMLPLLDFQRLSALPPKWISGYSDLTTLTFPLTLCCDIATVHGANLMNMGCARIHESDLQVFRVMSETTSVQHSAPYWGEFASFDIADDIYALTNENRWKSLDGGTQHAFSGRMIGGCMDTICKLIGTRFAPVDPFIERYRADGLIWTLESCEMSAGDIYRTLWQMRQCGWFEGCTGILIGRPDGYNDTRDFTLLDALHSALGDLNVPVIHDADIGHIPPQIQIINGAMGQVDYQDGRATVTQTMTP